MGRRTHKREDILFWLKEVEGGKSAEQVARENKVAPSTVRSYVRGIYALPPEYPVENPGPRETPAEPPGITIKIEPRYRIAQLSPDGLGVSRGLAIGDIHVQPNLSNERLFWMGRYIAEQKLDWAIQIGDFASFDSLCRYVDNGSFEGKTKPTYKEDLESIRDAMKRWTEGLNGYQVEKHITLGNHEDRIYSFQDRNPEVYGMLDENFYTLLGDYKWSYSPFGAIHYLGGVGFTHVPLTRMGRPFGGQNSENQIGNSSVTDLVYGHSHKPVNKPFPKIGTRTNVRVVNLGCALPDGHVEQYAKHTLGGWEWCVWDMTIKDGAIYQANQIPMTWLEERYGR